MALALENGTTIPYEVAIRDIADTVVKPWITAGVKPPTLSVKEVARTGREQGLTEEIVVQALSQAKGDSQAVTLVDLRGKTVNGNLFSAAREAAPYKRVVRHRGYSSAKAYELGRGRLRLVVN